MKKENVQKTAEVIKDSLTTEEVNEIEENEEVKETVDTICEESNKKVNSFLNDLFKDLSLIWQSFKRIIVDTKNKIKDYFKRQREREDALLAQHHSNIMAACELFKDLCGTDFYSADYDKNLEYLLNYIDENFQTWQRKEISQILTDQMLFHRFDYWECRDYIEYKKKKKRKEKEEEENKKEKKEKAA